MTNKENKAFLFFMYIIIFLGVIYIYGSSVVFYFDQKQGDATITLNKGKKIYLEYFHSEKKKKIKIIYKDRKSELQELKSNMKVDILYSNRYPTCIAFLHFYQKLLPNRRYQL